MIFGQGLYVYYGLSACGLHCILLHLIKVVVNNCRNFNMMSNSDICFWLLICENDKIIQELANFVHMNLDY